MPPRQEPIVERYLDIMQAIEKRVIEAYRKTRSLQDYQVNKVYQALEHRYRAERQGRPAPAERLTEQESALREAIERVAETYIRRSDADNHRQAVLPVEDAEAVFKRLQKSIKLWTNSYGVRGYLDYINEFFPE